MTIKGIRTLSWMLVGSLALLAVMQAGWNASAGLPHIIAGGVPGPGANPADPTAANPANAANATFYLIDKPAEPIVRDAQLDPADGTVPASFQADVGTAWNWDPVNPTDDQVVVVVEAVRGLNGWTGVNYTASAAGVIDAAVGVQDLGDAPLERIPTLTPTPGPDYIRVGWTALSASVVNVANYTVYRAPSMAGPWTAIGRSGPNNPGGPMSFNNTGLAEGSYCYTIAVNYQRNLAGGVYVTAGRAEPVCASAGVAPTVVSTTPAEGATAGLTDAIAITFSEPMARASVSYTITPAVALDPPAWTMSDTVLTLTHTTQPFGQCVPYTFSITAGRDLAGKDLQTLPFLLRFTSVGCTVPTVVVTAPAGGSVLSGGSPTTISFTLSDDTPVAELRIWVNYTSSAGTGSVVADQTGYASPASVPWTLPLIDASDVRVSVDAIDRAGNRGSAQGAMFTVDSTVPTVTDRSPAPDATGVELNAPIRITFSEPMDRTATEGAITISPTLTLTPSDFAWGSGDTILTIAHTEDFQALTLYQVTIGTAARDKSSPGNAFASAVGWSFMTGSLTPRAPTNLRSSNVQATGLSLAWDAPTHYTTGTAIPATATITYKLFRATTSGASGTQIGGTLSARTYADSGLTAATTYYYTVVAVVDGVESVRSTEHSVPTSAVPPPTPVDLLPWIILLIIIALVIVIAILAARRRKKPAEMPAKPEEEAPALPPEEAEVEAFEEEVAEAEAEPEEGETFVPCPNCGTMVKPTDAECFVCGAKL